MLVLQELVEGVGRSLHVLLEHVNAVVSLEEALTGLLLLVQVVKDIRQQ